MAIYQSTGFFASGPTSQGWAETWYRNTEDTDLQAIAAVDAGPNRLWGKRVAMLGKQAQLKFTRTSFVDQKNDGYPLDLYYNGPDTYNAAYPALCCLWRFMNPTENRWKNVYLRGIPDLLSELGGIAQFTSAALVAWMNAANAWATVVTADGWGWYGAKITTALTKRGVGYGVDIADERYIKVTGEAGTFPAEQVNTYQTVNFAKVNEPYKSALNGRHRVYVTSQTECRVVQPMALFPWNGAPFVINRFNPALIDAVTSAPRKIVRHDTGKVSGVPRGRSPERPRG